jgi:acyl transferase domain-containing protein/NADPH:quinone reductase-like Zn-dependent oxidoreductase/NAD(P)-dependent dehydrogenase (short-subunit alcohol dehydrogenase family)/SAM-dependent methyltransferase/acyl carrier protein
MTETAKSDVVSLSPLKQAFLALERAQERIRELEASRPESIAIVGIGCRIPGGEGGVDDYWHLLRRGLSGVGADVSNRLFDSLQGRSLPKSAKNAALLKQIDRFDPRHFGISPREAVGVDPQQRLLLEVCWEAIENAGIDPENLYQSQTGVYVGLSAHDYAHLQLRGGDTNAINPHFASGVASSVAAGRISYVLGLNGPALSLDTACSSSLVAIHLACEALRHGECSAALAGGVNLIMSPEPSIAFAQAGMLSESGVCRAFDFRADGFVRGEGCGVLLLKRQSEAMRDGDHILGLILSSVVNQDGASSGLTVPNGLAQQLLLREAHRRAGIEARQVGYVEAHGTGTSLGDPIEAEALGSVFAGREKKLAIGSVKTNVGHLESAAGVAGLIKVVLGMQHGEIPAQLHWERPSEHVRWEELPLEVVTEARAWEPIDGRRIAGVSSFGFSGTNAHVVLESSAEPERLEEEGREEVLVLSARTAGSLRHQAERYADLLEKTQSRWEDICYTAAVGRSVFGERLAVAASSRAEAARKLRLWLESDDTESGVSSGQVSASQRSRGGSQLGASATCTEVAEGFVRGALVDWAERMLGRKLRRVSLPTYAFERERYWVEATAELEVGEPSGGAMLGRKLRSAGVRAQYETRLESSGWVGEHVVDGRVVLPATGHLELMLEAAAELGGDRMVEDVVLVSPLVVAGTRRVQVVVEEEQSGRSRVRVYAEKAASEEKGIEWERCSEGWLREPAASSSDTVDLSALRERLREGMGSEELYPALEARGLRFGERFRGVERVWTGPGEALGEIAEREPAGAGWQLAPWWLDACLQVAGVAAEEQMAGDLYLPMSLEQLQLHAQPRGAAWSHVQMERIDAETLKANLSILNPQGQSLLLIKQIRFRKIKKHTDVASWLYKLVWEPAELNTTKLTKMLSHETARLESSIASLSESKQVLEYQEFFAELEQLSADYTLQAFAQLGWPDLGQRFTIPSIVKMWSIDDRHSRLFRRLLEIAVEAGVVHREDASYIFGAEPGRIQNQRLDALVARYPFGKTEIDLVVRCGTELAAVLTGKLDGHELVFPSGQSDEMASLYRDSTPARIFNDMVAEVVKGALEIRGAANTRVLEIGGGTGSTTQYIFNALNNSSESSLSEYLFTDISPLLVRRAHQHFSDWDGFQSKVFNLERSAGEQGITGPFNVIVAVNVIHATSDITATVNRLKQLLSPDGMLVIVEVLGKQRWADITVGLLDGWWKFLDRQTRPEYPALEIGQWDALLSDQGFGQVISFPKQPLPGSLFARQQLIVACTPVRERKFAIVGDVTLAKVMRTQLQRSNAVSVIADIKTEGVEPDVDAVVWIANRESALLKDVPPGATSLSVEDDVRSLLLTAQSLRGDDRQTSPRLYVITYDFSGEGEVQPLFSSPLHGLARGMATEIPELRCTVLHCSAESIDQVVSNIVEEVDADSPDQWVKWCGHRRSVMNLQRIEQRPATIDLSERVQLKTGSGINALAYVPEAVRDLVADEVEIEVQATALNFRDVLQSMDVVNLNLPLGTDCAGRVTRVGADVNEFAVGDRVVAIAPGSFASHVVTAKQLVVHKPAALTCQQAAAQCVAYLTADYCLNEIAQIKRGERVLIHAAAGGVGLAAVYLCLQKNAIPIATAGSEKKREFLRRVGVEHVYDSRSTNFASQIVEPIDVVLNSLAGNAIDRGLDLLAPGGRFIEIGKTDLRDPTAIVKKWSLITYETVDLSPLFAERSPWVAARLSLILGEIARGKLPLLPVKNFAAAQIHDAFRYMARAEHIGRIVIERTVPMSIRGTHLVTGGMKGIGLRLVEWLASHGATSLVLVGRNVPDNTATSLIDRLGSTGVVVQVVQGDIADTAVCAEAIRLAGSDLRGVWHSAGLLDNASLKDQSWQRMQNVFGPKVDGAWNLHVLTRDVDLDYFVMFSSWASVAGSYGQINHCAANAFMDSLAHLRCSTGLPGLSLNWGAWSETGAAASDELQRQLARSGIDPMAPADALSAMQLALREPVPQIAIAAINWPRYSVQHPSEGDRSLYTSVIAAEGNVSRKTNANRTFLSGENQQHSATQRSLEKASEASLGRTVSDVVRKTLDLRMDEEIDPVLPLSDLGMDSLLAIELRNNLSAALNRQFPSTILFDYPTLRDLIGYLNGRSQQTSVEIQTPDRQDDIVRGRVKSNEHSFDILNTIEQMSDEEVESLYQHDSSF